MYILAKIYGLPKARKVIHKRYKNTKPGREYIHKVNISNIDYYKVQVARNHDSKYISKIKYFRKLKEAKLFVDMLRENRYL